MFSKYKGLLSHCAFGLLNLLYPFSWAHVFVPILPESMHTITEAPCPFFVGLETTSATLQHLPEDVIEVDLDHDIVECPCFRISPPFAEEVRTELKMNILINSQKPDPILNEVDQAFNILLISPDDVEKFDWLAIRSQFVRYMGRVLGDYQKFIVCL